MGLFGGSKKKGMSDKDMAKTAGEMVFRKGDAKDIRLRNKLIDDGAVRSTSLRNLKDSIDALRNGY